MKTTRQSLIMIAFLAFAGLASLTIPFCTVSEALECELSAGATVVVDPGATIRFSNDALLVVENGATLDLAGTAGNPIQLTGTGVDGLAIDVHGVIAAHYVVFSTLGVTGVYVSTLGEVDPIANFSNCGFTDGSPGGCLLQIDNVQDFRAGYLGTIDGVTFGPGGTYGAAKTSTQGFLQFTNYDGELSGPGYENDPHQRILWGDTTVTPVITPSETPTPPFTPPPTIGPTDTPSAQTATPSPGPTGTIVPGDRGDIDLDSRITTTDALLCFQGALGAIELTPGEAVRADADLDGRVTTMDALCIFREALGAPNDCWPSTIHNHRARLDQWATRPRVVHP